jgi:hypothetical protein
LYGILGSGDLGLSTKWNLQAQIDAEAQMRKENFDLEKAILEKQQKLLDAQLERLKSGKPVFQISLSNEIAAPLEMIFTEIIRRVQVLAVENGSEFLMGF